MLVVGEVVVGGGTVVVVLVVGEVVVGGGTVVSDSATDTDTRILNCGDRSP